MGGYAPYPITHAPETLRGFRDWCRTRAKRHFNGVETVEIGGKLKPDAINGTLRVVRTFVTYGDNLGWWRVSPAKLAKELKQIPKKQKLPVFIKRDVAAALLRGALAVDEKAREQYGTDAGWPNTTFVAVGLCCPMRPGEIVHLAWSDIHLAGDADQDANIAVTFKDGQADDGDDGEDEWNTKTLRERVIPLAHAPQLLELLTTLAQQASKSPLAEAKTWVCCSHVRRARLGDAKKAWGLIAKRALSFLDTTPRRHVPKDMRSNATSRLALWKRDGHSVFNAADVAKMAGHSLAVMQKHYLVTVVAKGATFEEALGIKQAMAEVLSVVRGAQPSSARKPLPNSRRKRVSDESE